MKTYFVTRVLLRPLDDEPLPEVVPVSAELDYHMLAIRSVPTQYRNEHGWIIALDSPPLPIIVSGGEQLVIKVDDPYLAKRFEIVVEGGP